MLDLQNYALGMNFFIMEIRNMFPSVPEVMCGKLRTTISGKDAFAVAVCTHAAL